MDCSKTIDFFTESKRFCDSRTACVDGKEQCPLFVFCERSLAKICTEEAIEEAKKAMKSLQKWSDEHPKKTYAQDFFEKFPKAHINSSGTPFVCRKRIYGGNCDYTGACYRCWNEPMEE